MSKTQTRISILAALAAVLALAAAYTLFKGDGSTGANATGDNRKVVAAPIESASIATLESFPPQYVLQVTSGLPSGCAQFHEAKVTSRDGNTISVSVTNTVPGDDVTMCTMIYGMKETNLNLGSDFTPGETYTVDVNGTLVQFSAQ